MEAIEQYELKFHLYDGNEQDIDDYQTQYSVIREERREEGNVGAKVLSYFFDGLIALTNGDKSFWKGNNQEAYTYYQEASRMFTRFKNSRNANARLDQLAERMLNRTNGLIKITDAMVIKDQDTKVQLLTEALSLFNNEVAMANAMNEQISSYAAFSRASFTESQILLQQAIAIQETNSDQAKKYLMSARSSLKQSAYIDPRYFPYLEIIEGTLDNLTRIRLLDQAEKNADLATEESEKGRYLKAKEYFIKAMLFHNRASSLASDTGSRRKLLSTATVYEASTYEAEGNHLFRVENNTIDAAEKFEEAAKFVDKAIALLGHFGSKSLIEIFKCQRDYYKAMSLQSNAITNFDNEAFDEAKKLFEEGVELFESTKRLAKRGGNIVIFNMSEEAIADIKGYLSMVEAMI